MFTKRFKMHTKLNNRSLREHERCFAEAKLVSVWSLVCVIVWTPAFPGRPLPQQKKQTKKYVLCANVLNTKAPALTIWILGNYVPAMIFFLNIMCQHTNYQTSFITEISLIGSQPEVTLLLLYVVLVTQFQTSVSCGVSIVLLNMFNCFTCLPV